MNRKSMFLSLAGLASAIAVGAALITVKTPSLSGSSSEKHTIVINADLFDEADEGTLVLDGMAFYFYGAERVGNKIHFQQNAGFFQSCPSGEADKSVGGWKGNGFNSVTFSGLEVSGSVTLYDETYYNVQLPLATGGTAYNLGGTSCFFIYGYSGEFSFTSISMEYTCIAAY